MVMIQKLDSARMNLKPTLKVYDHKHMVMIQELDSARTNLKPTLTVYNHNKSPDIERTVTL